MNCRKVISFLSAYIDGEMNGIDMLAVREHLNECKACREDYESLRATKQLLAKMPTVAASDDLVKTICSRLDAIEMPMHQRIWSDIRSGFHIKLSPAFATVAAVFVAFLIFGAKGRTPQTYDVAKVCQQAPSSIALTLTDLGKNEIEAPDNAIPQSWQAKSLGSTARPNITFASFTQ